MTPLYTLLAPAAFAVAIPARLQAEPPLSVLFPPQGGETVIGETFQVVITAAGPFSRAVLERVEELQPAGAGPVLADQQGAFCLWLIPSGIAWAHPHGFCRSRGRSDLPPLDQTEPPGTYWVRTPRAHWVGPLTLATALDDIAPPPPPLSLVLLPPSAAPAPPTTRAAR
ncbi:MULTISPECIES: hypothetical protein [unclassified Streptomyces]|uniref:Uncharacterized protein n=1 Tax=Streptomyces sp. NBC_00060 TaxID=2975636 RepID=A0AAU2GTN4_9ACTN